MPGHFVPHIRLMDEGYSRIETAMQFGLPYVVKRKVRPYDTATLNYNWQVWNTEAFSLYTTATEQIDPNGVGQPLANIIHPYESELIETLYAPVDGRIFFIHNEPLTYANTAVIKLVR